MKDLLYLLGTSRKTMLTMFPPALYELPNNLFFEATGVLQIVPGILTGYYLFDFVQLALRRSVNTEGRDAGHPPAEVRIPA